MENEKTFLAIRELLEKNHIAYETLDHEPTHTSEESARARGVDISFGVKAIVMKAKDEFVLMCFSAARKLSTPKLRTVLGTRDMRFATKEELLEKTGLIPGSVPPFVGILNALPTYFDQSVEKRTDVWFNCGMLTRSLHLQSADLIQLVRPTIADFTEAL